MARDTQDVVQLQVLLLRAAGGVPAWPELQGALSALATDTDLNSAVDSYRSILDAGLAERRFEMDELLAAAFTSPVAFLGAAAVSTLVRSAKDLGRDFSGGIDVGPAAVLVTAPSVTIGPDPAVLETKGRALLGHLPINGLTVRLELGPINARGAGYTDAARGRAGARLRANLGPACVDVALLVEARNGVAVLALIRAEFRPAGIQLGFGFSLDSVGGIVGVNRSVDGAAMRDRIADGTALDALFGGGTDPDQIRTTLDALGHIFPASPGSHVVGPMLRLSWLAVMGSSLARLDIGVIVVIPSGRVLLPGRIVVEVPGPGVALVHLCLDVLGEVDVAGRRLALDAALVDSKVLGAFTVSGTAAVRLSWGAQPVLLATVGGFYPGFHHEPATIPPQRRIGITIATPIPAGLRMSLEGYVAAAAGTLQAGASVSVSFEVVGTGISGSASFDAIVQLAPLWFEANVHGRVALRAFGRKLVGVDLRGRLTGPGPLVLTVTATGEILCFDVGGTKQFTLSGGPGADRQPFDGLPAAVRRELENSANVIPSGGGDPDVLLAPRPASGAPLVPPNATLEWAQEAFPLDGPFTKAAGRILRHPANVRFTTPMPDPDRVVRRRLTAAAYTHVSGADAINIPQFEEREAGWRLKPSHAVASTDHKTTTEHRTVRLPVVDPSNRLWPMGQVVLLSFAVHAALRALDRPAALSVGVGKAVEVQPELWTATNAAGTTSSHRSGAAARAAASLEIGGRYLPAQANAPVVLP